MGAILRPLGLMLLVKPNMPTVAEAFYHSLVGELRFCSLERVMVVAVGSGQEPLWQGLVLVGSTEA